MGHVLKGAQDVVTLVIADSPPLSAAAFQLLLRTGWGCAASA